MAVARLESEEEGKKEVPKKIKKVLEEFKDVMPKELPKKLSPRSEVDQKSSWNRVSNHPLKPLT